MFTAPVSFVLVHRNVSFPKNQLSSKLSFWGILDPKRPKANQPLMPTTSPQNSPPHSEWSQRRSWICFFLIKFSVDISSWYRERQALWRCNSSNQDSEGSQAITLGSQDETENDVTIGLYFAWYKKSFNMKKHK